jgi:hypothetical protein
VVSIALSEALLCPETLKCYEQWLEADERQEAQAQLAARVDAIQCGTGLPDVVTAPARRVGTRPSDLMGLSSPRRSLRSPAAVGAVLRAEACALDDPLSVRNAARRPAPFSVVPIEGHPGAAEAERYLAEWKDIAAHEQAVLEGKCAGAGAGLAPDVDPSEGLAYWTHRYGGERRRGARGRLPFLGMIVSAKPVANADAESSFSRLKQMSDPHRQNIKIETLQYLFVASENGEVADAALRI